MQCIHPQILLLYSSETQHNTWIKQYKSDHVYLTVNIRLKTVKILHLGTAGGFSVLQTLCNLLRQVTDRLILKQKAKLKYRDRIEFKCPTAADNHNTISPIYDNNHLFQFSASDIYDQEILNAFKCFGSIYLQCINCQFSLFVLNNS